MSVETENDLKDFVAMLVEVIVDRPEQVKVNVASLNHRFIVELETARSDVGQVIGKQGHVATAIRSLLSAYGGKNKCKVELDYVTERQKRAEERSQGAAR